MGNYFEVLGVERDASLKEIKDAYHKLAMKYHPDHLDHTEWKIYLPKFLKITRAYMILSDEEKKKEYIRDLALGTFMNDQEKERKDSRDKVFKNGLDLLFKHPNRAIKYFKMAYLLERNNQTYKSFYGLALILSGRGNQGLKFCKEALNKEENDIHHYNLAYGYAKLQKFRNAVNHLKKCLRFNRNHKEAQNLLDKIKSRKGFFNRS